MAKTILVTGGAGFIGSAFIINELKKYPNLKIINYDALTYAGNLENLTEVENNPNYVFVKGDICDERKIEEIFNSFEINAVINFAAESHVDRSITDPKIFVQTNVQGTHTLLEEARKHWKINPNDKYDFRYKDDVKFLQVSTDEVYGVLDNRGKFTETMPLSPNSVYSASKASADLLVRAYNKTFGMPVNITRCSNNYGPRQFPEKLIPLMIMNCRNNKQLPVYGDGLQVRDWLYVYDHCEAIGMVLRKGINGEVYNIGGDNEITNIEIIRIILDSLGKDESLIKHVTDRPGHDRHYAIDNTKITTELGWRPKYSFDESIKETIQWYIENTKWVENVMNDSYQHYYEMMYGK